MKQPSNIAEMVKYCLQRAQENEARARRTTTDTDEIWHRAKADTYKHIAEKLELISD